MPQIWIEWIGALPAVIFPLASLSQLLAMHRQKSAEGVSVTTWVMVTIANISMYIYTQKYSEWQSIMSMLGAAALNGCVVVTALYYQRQKRHTVTK